MIDSRSLMHQKIIGEKIAKLGFKKDKGKWIFDKKIMNDEFLLSIAIENEIVVSSVTEIATNENYVLYDVENHQGSFVGEMRKEYEKIIDDVKTNCCEKNIFKSKQAELIITYVRQKFQDEIEYLWEKFPDNAIFRNKVNRKWYGALLVVEKRKIGIDEDGKVEIVDLLMSPEEIEKIVDNKNYFQGYHMNKKHWITIPLDGRIDIKKIYIFIDKSYEISLKK